MSNEKPALVDNSTPLQNYNHKPSVKLQHKLKLKRLSKITSKKAKEMTAKVCNEPVVYQKLTHKGQLLYYLNITKKCAVKVNALDGTIISKAIKK
jgi:uncharacterized membrane protein YkoI